MYAIMGQSDAFAVAVETVTMRAPMVGPETAEKTVSLPSAIPEVAVFAPTLAIDIPTRAPVGTEAKTVSRDALKT